MAYDQETLNILKGLQAAQPTTQQVDYSGFMNDFQPVQNYPNYFVPQQGLLQNTPTLDTLSDLDVMQQRPQLVTNMLNQYPTLENDFQRSFAVSPDTFNMGVYKPLPYDADYWNSFANQAGGTTGGDDTLATIAAGGLLAAATSGDDTIDGGTSTDSSTTTIDSGDDGDDGGTDTNIDTTTTVINSTNTNNTTNTDTTDTSDNNITVTDKTDSDDSVNNNNDTVTVANVDTKTDDSIKTDNSDNNVVTVLDANTAINNTNNDTITNNENTSVTDLTSATDVLTNLYDAGKITLDELNTNTVDLINKSSVIGINNALTSTLDNLGVNASTAISSALGDVLLTSNSTGFGYVPTYDKVTGAYTGVKRGFTPNLDTDQLTQLTASDIGLTGTIKNAFTDFMNNPLNEGFGAAGSGLNDATQFTGGELLSLGGGLLSLNAALEEATPTNVFGSAVGIGASGLLGGTAQGLATNPLTAPIGMALLFAEGLDADPSNKTGFSGFDLATSSSEDFGMGGDKFKQGNVDKASAISQGMGTAINTIADGFGLKTEGDVLVQTGNRDPLSVTYGNQETEQTADNRLNYNAETGDIINSTDDVKRFYYTGENGFDANMLASDLVKGTTLLSLKAIANGEDTIDLSNITKVAQSPDAYKSSLLTEGYTNEGADFMLNFAQSGAPDTMGLLGNRAVVATSENQHLTSVELNSLLEKGYTLDQINELLPTQKNQPEIHTVKQAIT